MSEDRGRGWPAEAAAAAADLLLGWACAGCGRAGTRLCAGCEAALGAAVRPCGRPGCPPVWCAAPYDGVVRLVLHGYKERQMWSLARPLARRIAWGLDAAAAPPRRGTATSSAVWLVPVPSAPAAVRRRGLDTTDRLARLAARESRRRGFGARGVRLLRLRRRVADQAGLGASERGANLAGAMVASPARFAPPAGGVRVFLVDDVVTTGATLREAARALAALGLPVEGALCVASTPRRR